MRNFLSRVSATISLSWWGRLARTIIGKPVNTRASIPTTFSSIGNGSRQSGRQGHTSSSWAPAIDNRTNEVVKIKFSTTDCQVCPSRSLCTQSIRHTRRTVTIRPHEQYLALKQRREQEKTREFTQVYAKRAGIEGTISQGVRTMGMRRSRYIGQEKTHLQHIATGAALNIVRCMAWLSGLPRAQTRRSAFTRL